jgi:ribosomal protein L11 methyltransferase
MYLWHRSVTQDWWQRNEDPLRARTDAQLVSIERPHRKRLQLEVASCSRRKLVELAKTFGGRVEKLPRDWRLRLSHQQETKPIKIGRGQLIIPAGAAFGTGEHATTTMCLRFLQFLARQSEPGWTMVDFGSGSGILALAAMRLGAGRAIGIDNDPMAISTASQNAKRNKIREVHFRLGDVRRAKFPRHAEIVTANLFSDLIVEILPRLKVARWLILSGVLRAQERELEQALRKQRVTIVHRSRRGKWIAILAKTR